MVAVFGGEREAVLARELTKTFETIRHATLGELQQWVVADANQQKGEFVLLLHGALAAEQDEEREGQRIADILADELPLKQAAALAARLSGGRKNALYQYLLDKKEA